MDARSRLLSSFGGILVVDVLTRPPLGSPRALVALAGKQLNTDSVWVFGPDDLPKNPPYPIGSDVLILGFGLHELCGIHASLGWDQPENMIDLRIEFRLFTNDGRKQPIDPFLKDRPDGIGKGVALALNKIAIDLRIHRQGLFQPLCPRRFALLSKQLVQLHVTRQFHGSKKHLVTP